MGAQSRRFALSHAAQIGKLSRTRNEHSPGSPEVTRLGHFTLIDMYPPPPVARVWGGAAAGAKVALQYIERAGNAHDASSLRDSQIECMRKVKCHSILVIRFRN
jgi:hypothetical protein